MKLEKVLDNLNSFEKNSFLKIIDGLLNGKPRNFAAVDKIMAETSKDLKNIDNINIARVFSLLEGEFASYIKGEFLSTTSQLDVFIDILSRDGNGIMKQDWFARLYEKEVKSLEQKLKTFQKNLEAEKSEIPEDRLRDYKIYKSCLSTAYNNDLKNNQDKKVTYDEHSILLTLASQLALSQEEIKLINYQILPIKRQEIESVINELKSIGVIFYSKKNSTIYVPDEIVAVLRKVRGKELPDKYFRRVLRLFREPQINLICRRHGIDWKLPFDEKLRTIISEGISFSGILIEDVHKPGTSLTDKKKFLNDLIDNGLKISTGIKGLVLDDKIANLIAYFEQVEKDEKVGISLDGYDKLLSDLGEILPGFKNILRQFFEFQEEDILKSSFLLDFNIKPRDVIELIPSQDIDTFCKAREIKTRGDIISNILEAYKDAENLYLENYEDIGFRNLNTLKANGIIIKEADLGIKFEELTKSILSQLGFFVDENLRKTLNTNKDKSDIVLSIGNNEIIIVECKTSKESGFNKFSAVSRQLKSYAGKANEQGYKVIKSLLVAPEFSDDFIKECGLEYELNLSLITASTLSKILVGFKKSKLKTFPHNLLMRDVLIQEERVLKAIDK
jgi:hypothetical protein